MANMGICHRPPHSQRSGPSQPANRRSMLVQAVSWVGLFAFEGEGDRVRKHVCNVAEPVLRVQLSRSPLAAQSYRLWIFPSVSAATTIINDELSIGSLVENFSTRHSIASLGLGLGMFVGQKAEMCRLMELGSNVGCTL
ncbi:hypothetical protein M431DRAFT_505823 [Trichoderma harzianum CBS 226.95]|uniref:Uncharacterized protein n=1 Tax=Trichoderma harzianum CBS 226.95 TaxID=983964 RepID=A0A2T4AMK3_TRIHA|nr:hypothetical protein M431DRAFT_505823 [Trichoderma harzianum CBS 226.95]PTB58293.1 hypothetical protein M431DRAFT_505823 [Trichoderma harzianum CBS 226.95]